MCDVVMAVGFGAYSHVRMVLLLYCQPANNRSVVL